MNFISEDIINNTVDLISDEDTSYEDLMQQFSESQPFLLSFLMSEGFDVLEEQEKSLLFYMSLVIFQSITKVEGEIETVTLEQIQKIDDEHWSTVDAQKFKTMKEIADHFFQDHPQEDLLAFVEDTLVEDEEYSISNIGRNVIFVSMTTLIRCFQEVL